MRIGQTSAIHLVARALVTIVGFLGTVYFANKLGADVLGVYFLVISVLMWLKLAAMMGVPPAVTKRVSEVKEGGSFVSSGLLIQLGLFGILSMLMYLFREPLVDYVGVSAVDLMILLLLSHLLFEFVQAVLKGERKVHLASLLIPVERMSRVVVQFGLVLLGLEVMAMLYGYVVAMVFATAVGLLYVSRSFVRPRIEHVRSLLSYSQYSWIVAVKGRTFHAMDTVVLGAFVSPGLIGIYVIAWNVSTIFSIFGDGISEAMFPEISKETSDGTVDRAAEYLNQSLAFAGLFVIPGLVGTVVIGDAVLAIYGDEFVQGGTVLVVLTLANLFNVYESQFTSTLSAIDRPDLTFRINAAYITVNLVLNVLLIYMYGLVGAAVATAVAVFVGMTLGYVAIRSLIPVDLPLAEITEQWISAAVMAAAVLGGRGYLGDSIPVTVVLVFVGAGIYFAILFGISSRFRGAVVNNLPTAVPTLR